jgi:hypothetical protein
MDKGVLAAVLAVLLAASESLGITDKIRANSIVQLIGGFVLKLLGKKE